VTTKVVKRPAVISSYYNSANAIDRHNHLRQGILAYETLWSTQSPWFRLVTTLVFGMTLTDAYLLGKYSVEMDHRIKRMKIKSFAAGVARDLVKMTCFKDTLSTAASYVPRLDPTIGFHFDGPDSSSSTGTTFSFDMNCQKHAKGPIEWSDMLQCVPVPDGAPLVDHSVLICHPRGTHKLSNSK
jgi:hypothetical protein